MYSSIVKLATPSIPSLPFTITSKRYEDTRRYGFATSASQSRRIQAKSIAFPRGVPSKARCTAARNIKCSATQTQTVQRKSSARNATASAPVKDKVKGPILDDGGIGFPPRHDGGGGGGGGGWGPSSGGFFLFVFLMILDYLKELDEKRHRRDPEEEHNQLVV